MYPLLDTIHSPLDLRALAPESLPELAQELRNFLLESVSIISQKLPVSGFSCPNFILSNTS